MNAAVPPLLTTRTRLGGLLGHFGSRTDRRNRYLLVKLVRAITRIALLKKNVITE